MGYSAALLERRSLLRRSRSRLRSGSSAAGRELGWGNVPQRAVRSVVVVILSPSRRELTRSGQALELLQGQELIPQATVEALGIAILPWAPRFDVQGFDLQLPEPSPDRVRYELGAVVTANMLWHPTHREQLCERIDHVFARDAPITLQSKALPRVLVHNRQPFQRASAGRLVEHEVPRSNMVLVLRLLPMATVLAPAKSSLLPLFHRDF